MMRSRRLRGSLRGARIFVRSRVPLSGLEALAERLNALEASDPEGIHNRQSLRASLLRRAGMKGLADALEASAHATPALTRVLRELRRTVRLPPWARSEAESDFWGIAQSVIVYVLAPTGEAATQRRLVGNDWGTPQGVTRAIREILRGIFGEAVSAHLKRCEVCRRWMVARYRTGRRHRECHSKVWTRARRREAGHAQYQKRSRSRQVLSRDRGGGVR